jgi:hypothetical protein
MSQLFQEEDDRNDLDDVLSQDTITPQEKARVARLLPNEVWQGRCLKCGKLAVRLFPPRKQLDLVEKKGGIKAVMDSCKTNKKNQRVLVDTPSFNMIITGDHKEMDGFNLINGRYHSCDTLILITDSPRNFIWHFFSRLRVVRQACLINGIKYQEVKDWYDHLNFSDATLMFSRVVRVEEIPNPDKKIAGGPWYTIWVDTSNVDTVTNTITSKAVNGDPEWDACMEPVIGNQLDLEFMEYSSENYPGDNLVDESKYALGSVYTGSSLKVFTVEPVGAPGKFVEFHTMLTNDSLHGNDLLEHLVHSVPKKYWMIEKSLLRPGKRFTSGDQTFITVKDR